MRDFGASALPGQRGAVTAELAVVLPAVLVVLLAVLATGQVLIGQIRCVDAARAGARVAARGESDATVRQVAGALAPGVAAVAVRRGEGLVRVEVMGSVTVSAPVPRVPLLCAAVTSAEVP